MRKSRRFISMPIVSIEEGLQIGTIKGLVINPEQMEVAALIIDQRGWFREQKIVPYGKVKNVGGDAITIDQSTQVQKTTSLPEILKLIREKANPIGTKVIVENGTLVGHVDEYYIDEATGKIVVLEISGKLLDNLFKGKAQLAATHIRTMGTDVIVLQNGAQEYLIKVDGGLQDTFSNIKESTAHLWESTKTKTKKLSHNIKEKAKEKNKSAPENAAPVDPGDNIELSSEPVTIIQENIEAVITEETPLSADNNQEPPAPAKAGQDAPTDTPEEK